MTLPPGSRNPFEAFLLLLSLASTLPLLQGDSGSKALEATLPDSTVVAWGITLGVGSALALIGLWWRGDSQWTAWLLERAGLVLVAPAAVIYGFVIIKAAGNVSDVRFAASVQAAYAGACIWRCIQISGHLRRGRLAMDRRAAADG